MKSFRCVCEGRLNLSTDPCPIHGTIGKHRYEELERQAAPTIKEAESQNQPLHPDFLELLNLVEGVTRAAHTTPYHQLLKFFSIKDSDMQGMKKLVERHLGPPYVINGGKRYRDGKLDNASY